MIDTDCDHPKQFLRHLGRSMWVCLGCDHESTLKDRPYYCGYCENVHSLTLEEYQEHCKTCPFAERRSRGN